MAVASKPSARFQGNDKVLCGLILGVVTFWLFAQTTLNIAPDMGKDLGLDASTMNIAVAATALFSGIFIVVMGGLADRFGRVRIVKLGFYLSIGGSMLVCVAPVGSLATMCLLAGRALQGLSGACIMPASLALVKTYWTGAGRQRAVSLWSIGSWGGSGLCALFGGLVTQHLGWRYIFGLSVVVAVIGLTLIRDLPESRADVNANHGFDYAGVLTFMVAMVALQIVVTQGNKLGWASPLLIILVGVAAIFAVLFFRIEARAPAAFIDFSLFANSVFTGATVSNFLLNAVSGTQLVSLQLVQLGGGLTAQQSGLLTLGYAIAIILFIRVGEKLLQRFGARRPMIWGCVITGISILLLVPTNVLLVDYKVLAIVGYTLFGVGLAFYATPSTDAALSSLPESQAGAGSGLYKWLRRLELRSAWRFPRRSSPP
jgi:DHA2 family multidrug resistance protein-like MFS transporter